MMRSSGVVIVALLAVNAAAVAARAQSADEKAVIQHQLTLELIERAIAVDRGLVEALKKDPGLLKRNQEKPVGIDGSAAAMNKVPEVARLLQQNEITGREYLLTQLAIFGTSRTYELIATGKLPPLPPTAPVHNLEFWRKNLAALKPLEAEWKTLRAEILKYSK